MQQIKIDSYLLDAQLIFAAALDLTPIDVQLARDRILDESEVLAILKLLRRRLQFEPMAYLLGKKEFYGAEFLVSDGCLIPRPDTEVVVEKCIDLIVRNDMSLVYDLCTGSGAIAISLLRERANLLVEASDISPDALRLAKDNASRLMVSDRLILHHGDLLSPFYPHQKAHLIVANPPYIPTSEIEHLASSVRAYEPHLALNGGDDGLEFFRRIIKSAPLYLRKDGYLVMEIGFDQADQVRQLVGPPFRLIEFFDDLASNTRGIVLQQN